MDAADVERSAARVAAMRSACLAHPWEPIRLGLVYTQDELADGTLGAVRPLPATPYLKTTLEMILSSRRGMLGKSRQVLMSWLFCWLLLWDALALEARHNVIQGKREDDVSAKGWKGMLGRCRFMREHLPAWLAPDVVKADTLIETYANGSALEAIAEGGEIVRSRVPSRMFLDEMCFHESAEANWNAANPAAGWMWGVSTPNGHEFKWRQGDPGRPWDDWCAWPLYDPAQPGLHSYVNRRGIRLAFLHYTADPSQCTPEAQDRRRSGYTDERLMLREQEGNYYLYAGLGVYAKEFNPATHVIARYQVDPRRPIYCGWDFGYNGQAVSFLQHNLQGQLVWFGQIIRKQVALPVVVSEVRSRLAEYQAAGQSWAGTEPFSPAGPPRFHYGDPAATQHNADGTTDIAVLATNGIALVTKTTTGRKITLVDQIRALLLPRSDGTPSLLVAKGDPAMEHVIAGFAGGYHYGEAKEGKAEKERPHKDGFYDHIFDGAQYAVDNISPIRPALVDDTGGQDWWKDSDVGVGQPNYVS